MSKPKNTSCATVQGQTWTKPNITKKKWNVQKVTRPFFFFRTKGGEHKKAELFVTTTTQTNKRKGKKSGGGGVGGSDSAFKDKHTMHLMETGAGLVT